MKPVFLIVASVITLTGCASPTASTMPTAISASAQTTCIEPSRIREQKVLNDKEIQFTMSGGEVSVNRMNRACPGLTAQRVVGWTVTGQQVCSNKQTIIVNDSGAPCQLIVFSRT